jgi:hypothetical protein
MGPRGVNAKSAVLSVLYREASESLTYSIAICAWQGWALSDGLLLGCAEEAAAGMVMVMVWTACTASITHPVLECG